MSLGYERCCGAWWSSDWGQPQALRVKNLMWDLAEHIAMLNKGCDKLYHGHGSDSLEMPCNWFTWFCVNLCNVIKSQMTHKNNTTLLNCCVIDFQKILQKYVSKPWNVTRILTQHHYFNFTAYVCNKIYTVIHIFINTYINIYSLHTRAHTHTYASSPTNTSMLEHLIVLNPL